MCNKNKLKYVLNHEIFLTLLQHDYDEVFQAVIK